MRKITTALLTGSALLLFTACGGGGGSSTPTDGGATEPEPVVNTYNIRDYIDKASTIMQVEGTKNGNSVEGELRNIYVGDIDYNSYTFHQHEGVFSNFTEGTSRLTYSDTYQGNIVGISDNYNLDCTIDTTNGDPAPIPTNATIGYTSDITTLVCTNGEIREISFTLDAGTGDNAVITATNHITVSGQAITTSSVSIVDPKMTLLSYELYAPGLSLHSTSIEQY